MGSKHGARKPMHCFPKGLAENLRNPYFGEGIFELMIYLDGFNVGNELNYEFESASRFSTLLSVLVIGVLSEHLLTY